MLFDTIVEWSAQWQRCTLPVNHACDVIWEMCNQNGIWSFVQTAAFRRIISFWFHHCWFMIFGRVLFLAHAPNVDGHWLENDFRWSALAIVCRVGKVHLRRIAVKSCYFANVIDHSQIAAEYHYKPEQLVKVWRCECSAFHVLAILNKL